MKLLIACDKFKGALSAHRVCSIICGAAKEVNPEVQCHLAPLTDGGDGFCEVMTELSEGQLLTTAVSDPLGAITQASYGIAANTAYIEMAQASGIALLPKGAPNIWKASTFGTGELIKYVAEEHKPSTIVLGIGGSATHDLGLGALQALGLRCMDDYNNVVKINGPGDFAKVVRLHTSELLKLPGPIKVAVDVENPLLGPEGAAAVYGPQKGLTTDKYETLEAETTRMANLMLEAFSKPKSCLSTPGAGAAGGIGFGLQLAFNAQFVSGFLLWAEAAELEKKMTEADLVITGEGRFDRSSLSGKGPGQIISRARRLRKPVHIFAGQIDKLVYEQIPPHAEVVLTAITPQDTDLSSAIRDSHTHLTKAVKNSLFT